MTDTTADRRRTLGAKGSRTRQRILDAAERVFGYHDASIVRITEAAGVAQGTFYYAPGWNTNPKTTPVLLVHGANDNPDRAWPIPVRPAASAAAP
jgi:hypothetical protein